MEAARSDLEDVEFGIKSSYPTMAIVNFSLKNFKPDSKDLK